ncbi:MAG: amino acid ABC transporter permease [Actinomycetota bacterium]
MSDQPLGPGLQEDVGIPRFDDRERAVEVAPVKEPTTPLEWVRDNLFSSWANSIVTIVAASGLVFFVYQLLKFIFVSAEWPVVVANLKGFMVGPFPLEETWRVWVSAYLVAVLGGLSAGASPNRLAWTNAKIATGSLVAIAGAVIVVLLVDTGLVLSLTLGAVVTVIAALAVGRRLGQSIRRPMILAWLLSFPLIMVIVVGFGGVSPRLWGGFFFNLVAATVGIFVSFPIGILLALGRRSSLPAVRTFSVVFIEIFRGVPLVAWLIFSKFVVGLLLPPQMSEPPDIIKAFTVVILFSAAYVAEIVRGGLQGVHEGQYEAARALGLSTTRMMALVVLPQALRSTIPAMISHFISLYKDTALFVAIEVTDLLEAARRSAVGLQFFGRIKETLLFAGLLFWIVAFSMSRWSQRLEARLGVGER